MTLTRLESFPFDSRYDGYDDDGYPVYDRAVGAKTMRDVFAHFFSDGVFSDTTYPFRLTKASSGLAVTVNPGVIIINGGWGILPEQTTLTLATGTTAGIIKYAVFARYDNNDEHRTIYLRTDASAAGGAVPEPVTTEANVTEYRIGYISVPSNSTDLSNATVTNEVGTSKCPYAVPLFNIDPAEVLEDLRNDAQAAYDKYYALLASSIDGTTAGYLQNQIDEHDGRIATLEENQFTQESIDPLALRAEMGLGPTGGVLQQQYGGTGVMSFESVKIPVLIPDFDTYASASNYRYYSVGETVKAGTYLAILNAPNQWVLYLKLNGVEYELNPESTYSRSAFAIISVTEDTVLTESESGDYIRGWYSYYFDTGNFALVPIYPYAL